MLPAGRGDKRVQQKEVREKVYTLMWTKDLKKGKN